MINLNLNINLKQFFKNTQPLDIKHYILLQLLLLREYDNVMKYIFKDELRTNWEDSFLIQKLIGEGYIRPTGLNIKNIFILPKSYTIFPKETLKVKEIDAILIYFFVDTLKWSLDKGARSAKAVGNRKFVSGRLDDGYSVEEIKKVITFKHPSRDIYMRDNPQYYRIETLLNATKFQSYYTEMEANGYNTTDINTTDMI